MKKLISLAIVVVIAMTMVVTCPDKAAHEEAVKKELKDVVRLADNESKGMIEVLLGTLLSGVMDNAVDYVVNVDNYVVCSVGRIEIAGLDKAVSLGVFGHVFMLMNADDVAKKMNEEEDADTDNIDE